MTTDIETQVEEFANHLVEVFNHGALCLTLSVGHRTGIFDTMGRLGTSDPATIAKEANLNERYVREWLGAATTGGLVQYDESAKTYTLPPEKAAVLTRDGYPQNLAVIFQYLPVMARVEDGIVKCFRDGGGLDYSNYPRFHEVMAEDSSQTVIPFLVDAVVPLAPGLKEKLESGIDVLDVGCGGGRAVITLAKAFPNSRFSGYDLSSTAIAAANAEAKRQDVPNATFVEQDAVKMADKEKYDLITAFDAIHDQVKPREVLANIHKALKPGGVFLMADIAGSSHLHKDLENPLAPFLYTISYFHCMSVSLSGGGEGLGTMWGEEKANNYLEGAGFKSRTVHRLEGDIQNLYIVSTK